MAADLEELLGIAHARRQQYERYQPVFWRPAGDAVDRQRPYFRELIEDGETVILVAEAADHGLSGFAIGNVVAAPPVYDPGGLTCIIDDFAVKNPDQWLTVGVALLRALGHVASQRGASQVVVICGHRDDPKRAALAQSGLQLVSEWWVGPPEAT